MKAREYDVLCRAVEDGVAYGWRRAHKHVEDPDEHTIQVEIQQAVVNTICEWFDFDNEAADET